jgi:hypothetical protein
MLTMASPYLLQILPHSVYPVHSRFSRAPAHAHILFDNSVLRRARKCEMYVFSLLCAHKKGRSMSVCMSTFICMYTGSVNTHTYVHACTHEMLVCVCVCLESCVCLSPAYMLRANTYMHAFKYALHIVRVYARMYTRVYACHVHVFIPSMEARVCDVHNSREAPKATMPSVLLLIFLHARHEQQSCILLLSFWSLM